jgi:hypothetical protein
LILQEEHKEKREALSDYVIDKINKGSCSTNLGLIETL